MQFALAHSATLTFAQAKGPSRPLLNPCARIMTLAAVCTALAGCALAPEQGATTAAEPACCVELGDLRAQGPLDRGRDLRLDARSAQFRFDSGAAPVSVWRFDTPPVGAWLELLVDDQGPRAADAGRQPIEAPWPTVLLVDDMGQVLPARLIGPQLERRGRMRLRWWLALPSSSARLLVGLDASAVGQLRPLSWNEPAPEERVAGVLVRGAERRQTVALRATEAGEVQVRLHAN